MEKLYKCETCDSLVGVNDNFCMHCGDAFIHDKTDPAIYAELETLLKSMDWTYEQSSGDISIYKKYSDIMGKISDLIEIAYNSGYIERAKKLWKQYAPASMEFPKERVTKHGPVKEKYKEGDLVSMSAYTSDRMDRVPDNSRGSLALIVRVTEAKLNLFTRKREPVYHAFMLHKKRLRYYPTDPLIYLYESDITKKLETGVKLSDIEYVPHV